MNPSDFIPKTPDELVMAVAVWFGLMITAYILAKWKGLHAGTWMTCTALFAFITLPLLCLMPKWTTAANGKRMVKPHVSQFAIVPLVVGAIYFLSNPLLTVPKQCSDISTGQVNAVLANAPLVKLLGTKVLEITATRDTGSIDSSHLSCAVDALLSTGVTSTLTVSTNLVNGNPYLYVSLF